MERIEAVKTGLVVAFTLLQGVDLYTTLTILKKGGVEKNPILLRVFALFGPEKSLVAMKLGLIAGAWYIRTEAYALYAMGAIVAIYTAVAVNNLIQLRRMQ